MVIAFGADTTRFASMPEAAKHTLGNCHWIDAPVAGGNALLVCNPQRYRMAAAILAKLGFTVLPPLRDPVTPIGPDAAAALAPFAGTLAATDTAFAALSKLHAAFPWPMIDPAEI